MALNDTLANKAIAKLRQKLARQQEMVEVTKAEIELYEAALKHSSKSK
jgi:hypothetical protein